MSYTRRKDKTGHVLRTGETQRSDGRYAYSWTDSRGKRKVRYAPTLLELRKLEKQLMMDLADGVTTYDADSITVNQLWNKYINQKHDLKRTTKSNYIYTYNHFVRNSFGNMKLGKVKYTHVKDFYYELIEDEDVAIQTVDNINTLLHPTFQMAVRDGLIRMNPTDGAMNEIKKANPGWKKKRRALTVPQQRNFVNFIDEHDTYEGWYPILVTMLGTGMRVGEAIGLRWEDVDFKNRIISVNHALVYRPIDGKSQFMISPPKTEAGIREIPIIDEVYDALIREYQVQKCTGGNASVIDGYSGFIFTNAKGTVFEPNAINRAIKRIVKEFNEQETEKAKAENRKPELLPEFSNHVLRHTFCTRLCESTTDIKVIQTIMGHKDIQVTLDTYAECTSERKQETLQSLTGKIIIR